MMTGPVKDLSPVATFAAVILSAPMALKILAYVSTVVQASGEKTFVASPVLSPACPEASRNALASAAVASLGRDWAMPYVQVGRSPPSPCATSGVRQMGVETTGL